MDHAIRCFHGIAFLEMPVHLEWLRLAAFDVGSPLYANNPTDNADADGKIMQ